MYNYICEHYKDRCIKVEWLAKELNNPCECNRCNWRMRGGVFFVFVTQMFVAFDDGTTSGVFVGQRIAGIPQIDPDVTVIIAAIII